MRIGIREQLAAVVLVTALVPLAVGVLGESPSPFLISVIASQANALILLKFHLLSCADPLLPRS
jgi:hypothetical protein